MLGRCTLAAAQVICVAEGAGQEAMEKTLGTDASGNPILADVGIFLRDTLKAAIKVRWRAQCCCCCCCCLCTAAAQDPAQEQPGVIQEALLLCQQQCTACGVP